MIASPIAGRAGDHPRQSPGGIGRKGKTDPAFGGRLSHPTERDELRDISGRAGACYLLEIGKIAPRLATGEATVQAQREASPAGGIARRADQRGEWTVPKVLLVVFATLAKHRVGGVTVTPQMRLEPTTFIT